ncbi:MAG: NAD-dependent epimerase/dehydratase family protein [Stellaceae bacterium]
MPSILIIGGDSAIGAEAARAFHLRGWEVAKTTRRPGASGRDRLDLAEPLSGWPDLPPCDVALVLAAVTSGAAVAANPKRAKLINVERTGTLIRQLQQNGTFVLFPSTSLVFSGDDPFPAEASPVAPLSPYAEHKVRIERLIEHGAVLRLTKVLMPTLPLLRGWHEQLSCGNAIKAFGNLPLAPVSLDDAVAGLVSIATSRRQGIFHLSGDRDISYRDVALALAEAAGAPSVLVRSAQADAISLGLQKIPRHGALGMARTQAQLGLAPRPVESVIASVVAEFRSN